VLDFIIVFVMIVVLIYFIWKLKAARNFKGLNSKKL